MSFFCRNFFSVVVFLYMPFLLASQLNLVSTEADPDAFIQNSVNVINGDYCESATDLVIAGPDALCLQRFYSTKDPIIESQTGSWKIFPERFLVIGKDLSGKSCKVGKDQFQWASAFVGERSGGILCYNGWRTTNGTTRDPLKVDLLNNIGMVNTYAKEINGQTNHQNNLIHCKGYSCELILGDGTKRIYQEVQQLPTLLLGEEFTASAATQILAPRYYQLTQEILPSGNHILFSYDTAGHLVSIEMKNNALNKTFSWIHLTYNFQGETCEIYIETSDKRTLTYHLTLQNGIYQLIKVEGSHCIPVSYKYNPSLVRKELPNNRFYEIEYEEGKVKLLKRPNHQSGNSEVFYSFFYEKNYTEAFDSLGIKNKYIYDNRFQLNTIERYDHENKLYRIEQKFWGKTKADLGLLLAKTIADHSGKIYAYRSFLYDKYGNVTEEKLYGNLSGQDISLQVSPDGKLLNPDGKEYSIKTFSFSSDGFNLLTKMGDCKGNYTLYIYQTGTNHLGRKFIFDNKKVKQRNFYFYNEDGVCIKVIEDDGAYEKSSLLIDVKERHIREIIPKTMLPGVGLPETIEEKSINLQNEKEFLIRKLINIYDDQGNLCSCSTYDANGVYAFTEKSNYNNLGLITSKTTSSGKEIYYNYDEVGNQISFFSPSENKLIITNYDFHDQPIEIIQVTSEGQYTTYNTYDASNRKISSTDRFGNSTYYEYDCFHRLTKLLYPEVLDENNQLNRPIFQYRYDLFGNVIGMTDPKGFSITKSYNLYGKPVQINYPDGTFELFKYDPEGSLHRSLDREKIITIYEYDYLGRCIHEEVSRAGETGVATYLMTRKREYSAFRLKAAIEKNHATNYYYDSAGRLTSFTEYDITQGSRDLESRVTEINYDSFNRPYMKKIWFDKGSQDFALEYFEYDLFGNIIEKRTEDVHGTVLLRRFFSYNNQGLCTEEYTLENGTKALLVQTCYDSEGNLISYTDGLSQETKVLIDNSYKNFYGQTVLKKTLINPMGVQTEIEFDPLARVYSISKMDSSGILLSSQKNIYDLIGNKIYEIHEKIIDGEIIDSQKVHWIYGPMSRLEEEIQAIDSPLEQHTYYSYDSLGKMVQKSISGIDSPIHYTYDNKGNLVKIEIYDKNKKKLISNSYAYDQAGNIREASSLDGKSVQRNHNIFNQVIQETVKDGNFTHKLKYFYDRKGRLKKITLPDQSAIIYTYNAAFGCSVQRLSTGGEVLYSHTYDNYNEQGLVLNESHIGYIGSTTSIYSPNGQKISNQNDFSTELYSWDSAGRLLAVQGDKYKEYSYTPLSQVISEKQPIAKTYAYDSLDNRIKSSEEYFSYNALNQLTASSRYEFSYDPQGNLIKKNCNGEETSFEYNLLAQLTSIENPDKTTLVYSYDALGRLLSEKHLDIKEKNQKTLSFLHFFSLGHQEIGTLSEKGTIETLKVPGLNGNEVASTCIALEIKGETYGPLYDISGNIIALVDPLNREIIESYEYTIFGEEVIYNTYSEIVDSSLVGNPWRFAGKRINQKSGLIIFGFRFYEPSSGRWISPDPAGFIDGPNLYSYLHNNSLSYSDQFGLAAKNNQENKFNKYFYGEVEPHCYCEKHRTCKRGGDIGITGTSRLPKITYANQFEEFYSNYKSSDGFKETFALYDEFHPYYETSKIYDLSDLDLPELPDLEIGFINGIDNSFECAKNSALHLSKIAGGCNVHSVYNATHGMAVDLKECKMGIDYIATEPVRQLHKMWNSFFEKSSANGKFLMVCHSQGAIHVKNALLDYPEELQKRILVVAIAPGSYIYQESCAQVIHYRASKYRDLVPRLDQKGAERARDTILELSSHEKAPIFDHSFISPSYENVLLQRINNFKNSQGNKL